MARMIPNLEVDELDPSNLALFSGDASERAMYRALRDQLPDDWVVRYNYVFCYYQAGRMCPDGQADFIVIAPLQGLMFVEVKGANGITCQNGSWYWISDDGSLGSASDNPFQQAMSNKHKIVNLLEARCFGRAQFPGRYGHLVAFPRGNVVGPLPASNMPQITLLYESMENLRARIDAAFTLFGSATNASNFSASKMTSVVSQLEDNMKIVPVAAADVDEDDRKIQALTKRQWEVFRGILSNRRVKINGVAGSGKTMLALWAAELYAREKKVLFLCYNTMLKNWIELNNPLPERQFKVETFHSLVGRLCQEANIQFTANSPQSWRDDAPVVFLDALNVLGESTLFDVIVVDEAQDFQPQWWTPLEFMLRNQMSIFLMFADPRQKLYVENTGEVHATTVFELVTNCRNTQNIADYCGQVISEPMESFELSPVGSKPTIRAATPDVGHRRAIVREVVNRWLNNGFKPGQIAILSPWSSDKDGCVLNDLGPIATVPVVAGDGQLQHWRSGNVILGDTIKSFKGLEADCVVISDLPNIGASNFSLFRHVLVKFHWLG